MWCGRALLVQMRTSLSDVSRLLLYIGLYIRKFAEIIKEITIRLQATFNRLGIKNLEAKDLGRKTIEPSIGMRCFRCADVCLL